VETMRTVRITAPGELYDRVYSQMAEAFGADVIDEKDWYAFCLAETVAGRMAAPLVLLAIFDASQDLAGLIEGNYIPILDEKGKRTHAGFGAIGHVYASPEHRRSGLGERLVREFIDLCASVAAGKGHEYRGTIGEVQDSATRFFYRIGFGWPANLYYAQPPLSYDPATGRPICPETPETFMIKPHAAPGPAAAAVTGTQPATVTKAELSRLIQSLYHFWIVEKHSLWVCPANRRVLARIRSYVFGKVFRDVQQSIDVAPGERISLTSPPRSALLAQRPLYRMVLGRRSSVSLRNLVAEDLPDMARMLPRIFDPDSARMALELCRHMAQGATEPFLCSTVLLVTDGDGTVIGITGYYELLASTGWSTAPGARTATARLGWFGIGPEHRVDGIGQAALELTEMLAARHGFSVMCIETSSNPLYAKACRLYKHMGYRRDLTVRDYLGPGRPVVHYAREMSASEPPASPSGWEVLPINADVLRQRRAEILALAGREAESWAAAMDASIGQPRPGSPIAPDELRSVECRFWVMIAVGTVAAAFSLAQYLWIAADVYWVRWICADPSRISRAEVYQAIVQQSAEAEPTARQTVVEAVELSDRKVLRRFGFRTGSEAPDLYMPRRVWRTLLKAEYRSWLIDLDQLVRGAGGGCDFYIYSKRLGRS
jgi:GNAT superfamily N-acetyltransferase